MPRAIVRALGVTCLALVACTSASEPPPKGLSEAGAPTSCGACASYTDPEAVGRVETDAITELSGLAASRTRDGVFYTHNDSGDGARFFAIDRTGALLATYTLEGVDANDIEDVGVGPCHEGSCLYLADIGDNDKKRANIAIYRTPEPSGPGGPVRAVTTKLTYPDGPHNAEALLVSPEGDLVIVEKSPTGTGGVYLLDKDRAKSATEAVLTRIATLTLPAEAGGLVTGGAFHPCEKRVTLRTYTAMFEYRFTGGLETMFASPPTLIPAGREPQGEAVTYSANGRELLTASEGKRPSVHASACAP